MLACVPGSPSHPAPCTTSCLPSSGPLATCPCAPRVCPQDRARGGRQRRPGVPQVPGRDDGVARGVLHLLRLQARAAAAACWVRGSCASRCFLRALRGLPCGPRPGTTAVGARGLPAPPLSTSCICPNKLTGQQVLAGRMTGYGRHLLAWRREQPPHGRQQASATPPADPAPPLPRCTSQVPRPDVAGGAPAVGAGDAGGARGRPAGRQGAGPAGAWRDR